MIIGIQNPVTGATNQHTVHSSYPVLFFRNSYWRNAVRAVKARASKPQTQRFDGVGSDVSACQQAVFDVLLFVGNRQC